PSHTDLIPYLETASFEFACCDFLHEFLLEATREYLVRPRHLDGQARDRRLHAAEDFAGPQLLGEQRQETILEITDRAEQVISKRGVISVHAAAGQFPFDDGVTDGQQRSRARAKGFADESFDQSGQRAGQRCGYDQATPRGFFFKNDSVQAAILTHAVEVSEKVQRPRLGPRQSAQRGGPDMRGVAAARRFAALDLHQIESHRLYIRAQIERLDFHHVMQTGHRALRHPPTGSWRSVSGNPAKTCALQASRKTLRVCRATP